MSILALLLALPLVHAGIGQGMWAQLHSYNDLRIWPQALSKLYRPDLPVMVLLFNPITYYIFYALTSLRLWTVVHIRMITLVCADKD
jgi:hypothetical protein